MISSVIAFLSNLLLQRKNEYKIKNNIIEAILLCLIMFLPDFILKITGKTYMNVHIIFTIILILFAFLTSFSGIVVKLIVGTFLFVIQLTQTNYMYFSGMPIEPKLIKKIFAEKDDVFEYEHFMYVLPILPFVILPYVFYVWHSFKTRKRTYFSILSAFLIVFSYSFFLKAENKRTIDEKIPKPFRQTILNSLSTYTFFLSHLKSEDSMNSELDDIKKKAYIPYQISKIKNNNEENRIVILIWGESTNSKDMHIINNKLFRKNTPKLENFAKKNKNHFMSMTSISGSTATRSSAPLFFNLIKEPGNTLPIRSVSQNLFKMAKENGYKTHWLSSQGIIIPQDSYVFADDMQTAEKHIYAIKKKSDDYLIDLFKKLDLSKGKHLIVLNPRNTHTPYNKNYKHRKAEFEKYTDSKTRKDAELSAYHNCILYLDWWINEILSIAIKKNADYVLFSSDHGDFIGDNPNLKHGNSTFGHNLLDLGITYVPFMIYSKKNNEKMFNKLKEKKIITHYEIGMLMANLIGYNVKNPNLIKDGNDNLFFIHDASIIGDYRVIPYVRNDGKIIQKTPISAKKFMKKLISEKERKNKK